jgi:hypothetical protein
MATFPGFAHCQVRLTHADDVGDEYNITYGISVPNGATDQEIANLQFSHFAAAWADQFDTSITIQGVTCYFGHTPPDADTIAESQNTVRPGERDMSSLPANCSVLVKKVTGVGGRKNRGRNFFPFVIAEGDVTEVGVVGAARLANLQNAADIWLDQLDTGGVGGLATPMYILHSGNEIPTPVSNLVVDPIIATQRRRLRR